MGKALYRTYRSKKLSEIVGQEHITTALANALKTGKISHAYLFTGPRGVGKTSIARILAHEINSLPYTDDSTHLDIIEIDAASNRRIDEIRDLRDKVNVAPTTAKYKVYIIDEVHMLTREAFNALLKTLEEPPAHVVFILATTEAHKLPETIVSRTQRYTFRPIAQTQVIDHLRAIAKQEKLDIDDEALALIAAYGEGSFRDSISLLDQAHGFDGVVGAEQIRQLIGVPATETTTQLLDAVQEHDPVALQSTLDTLRAQGFEAVQVAKQLGTLLRHRILQDSTLTTPANFSLLHRLLEVPVAHNPETYLELTLLEAALQPTTPMPAQTLMPAPATAIKELPKKKSAPTPEKVSNTKPTPKPQVPEIKTSTPNPDSAAVVPLKESMWPQVLTALKSKHNTLHGVARMARPEFKDNEIVLHFAFAFHKKRLSETKNRQIITSIIHELTGQSVKLRCETDTTGSAPTQKVTPPTAPNIGTAQAANSVADPFANISNIFGNAEVLES